MLGLLYFIISSDMQKEKKRPLHVKTIMAVPYVEKKSAIALPQITPPKNKTAVSSPKPAPIVHKPQGTLSKKKQALAVEPKKNGVSAQKKAPPSPVPHLLHELEETIAKIDKKRDKDRPLKQKPSEWIKPLKIDAIKEISDDGTEVDLSYQEALVRCLREFLDLPEIGEVKMEITVNRDGTISKLRVLATESEKNKSYLEKNLQLIKFPPFSVNESKKTFILTFCNQL